MFFSRTDQGLFKLNKGTMGEVKQRKGCCYLWEQGLSLKSVFVLQEYLEHPPPHRAAGPPCSSAHQVQSAIGVNQHNFPGSSLI